MDVLGFDLNISLALLLLTPILAYVYLTWEHGFWQKQGIPGPRPLPVIGTALITLKTGFFVGDKCLSKKYGKVVGMYAGRSPELLLADVDILKQIMVKEFDNFVNRGSFGRAFTENNFGLNKMLTVLVDDEWRNVRKLLTPAFSANKLKVMMKNINDCADTLLGVINGKSDERSDIDMKSVTDLFTFDVIGRVGFAVDMNPQTDPGSPFSKYGRKIFNFSFLKPGVFLAFLFPGLYRALTKRFPTRLKAFDEEASSFFMQIIKQIVDERTKTTLKGKNDLIQLMLNAHTDEIKQEDVDTEIGGDINQTPPKRGLTYEEIVGQSFILFAAGFDTTSTTLTYLLYNLALHQECQDKLQEEIDTIVKDEEIISYEMIHSCPYLEMCIAESLRLFPPIARVDRECKRDITISGIFIPKNTTILISVGSLHYDPDVWPEPEKFKPERFTSEAKADRDPFYYMPFGMGPRNCIGMRIAQMELRVAIIKILQKFRVMTCEKTPIPLELDTPGLLKPRNPVVLKFEPRNGQY